MFLDVLLVAALRLALLEKHLGDLEQDRAARLGGADAVDAGQDLGRILDGLGPDGTGDLADGGNCSVCVSAYLNYGKKGGMTMGVKRLSLTCSYEVLAGPVNDGQVALAVALDIVVLLGVGPGLGLAAEAGDAVSLAILGNLLELAALGLAQLHELVLVHVQLLVDAALSLLLHPVRLHVVGLLRDVLPGYEAGESAVIAGDVGGRDGARGGEEESGGGELHLV